MATIRDEKVQLSAQGASLFVLGYTHALARTRLLRVSRAGGPVEEIAARKGLSEPQRFVVADGAAWYTQGGSVFKLGPASGAVLELSRGAHSPVALAGSSLFVVACAEKGDRLLQIPRDGGAAETLVTIARTSNAPCRYSSLVADERQIFIADWNGSRVLAVNRADRSIHELVSKKGFPSSLLLESDRLVLLSALGLLWVNRIGGSVTQLANDTVALAPFSLLRSQGAEYFVYDNLAYSVTNTLYRIPLAGGPPQAFFNYQAPDPAGSNFDDNGLRDFDVDDECAYIAQWQHGRPGVQLLAQAK